AGLALVQVLGEQVLALAVVHRGVSDRGGRAGGRVVPFNLLPIVPPVGRCNRKSFPRACALGYCLSPLRGLAAGPLARWSRLARCAKSARGFGRLEMADSGWPLRVAASLPSPGLPTLPGRPPFPGAGRP